MLEGGKLTAPPMGVSVAKLQKQTPHKHSQVLILVNLTQEWPNYCATEV